MKTLASLYNKNIHGFVFSSPVNTTDTLIKSIEWPKVTDPEDLIHLVIDSTFTVSHDYFKERVAFWDEITHVDSRSSVKDEF